MKHEIYISVAVDDEFGVGKNNDLPWRLKKELQYFQKLTTQTQDPKKQNMVIMGRKTWDSIPANHRPLSGRKNVVLTRQQKIIDEGINGTTVCGDLEEAYKLADNSIEKIFVIGGGSIFKQAVESGKLTGMYITQIHETFECDTFFPPIPRKYSRVKSLGKEEESGIHYEYLLYTQ